MTGGVKIRLMRPGDSQALTALEDETVDAGMVTFLTRYKHEGCQCAIQASASRQRDETHERALVMV